MAGMSSNSAVLIIDPEGTTGVAVRRSSQSELSLTAADRVARGTGGDGEVGGVDKRRKRYIGADLRPSCK